MKDYKFYSTLTIAALLIGVAGGFAYNIATLKGNNTSSSAEYIALGIISIVCIITSVISFLSGIAEDTNTLRRTPEEYGFITDKNNKRKTRV